MEFRILGSVEVWKDGRPVSLGRGKQRAVLALLVLDANRIVSSDRLIDQLWNGQPPASRRFSGRGSPPPSQWLPQAAPLWPAWLQSVTLVRSLSLPSVSLTRLERVLGRRLTAPQDSTNAALTSVHGADRTLLA